MPNLSTPGLQKDDLLRSGDTTRTYTNAEYLDIVICLVMDMTYDCSYVLKACKSRYNHTVLL